MDVGFALLQPELTNLGSNVHTDGAGRLDTRGVVVRIPYARAEGRHGGVPPPHEKPQHCDHVVIAIEAILRVHLVQSCWEPRCRCILGTQQLHRGQAGRAEIGGNRHRRHRTIARAAPRKGVGSESEYDHERVRPVIRRGEHTQPT